MKLLLKQVTITDHQSPHNGHTKDILITNGRIEAIADELTSPDAQTVNIPGLNASTGWVDTFAHFCDPGLEQNETLQTGALAAAVGGYTHVFSLPNTVPVVSGKSQVEYVISQSAALAVNILPLGAITRNATGNELAEMYDMRNSGAIAFTDGLIPVQHLGLLLKALQYVKAYNGILIQMPVDSSFAPNGQMNEGITSTRLGLPGTPAIAEELMVVRDVELARYTESRIHITGISTAKSIATIRLAKAAGIQVTCAVTPYHLYFCDEDLQQYNTLLKVSPPLRSRSDMLALREAVLAGDVDCIATHHQPLHTDSKICEFEYAKPGTIGLESCFGVVNSLFPSMNTAQLCGLLGNNARAIFGLPAPSIVAGAVADITLFERSTEYVFDRSDIKSKSINSAFLQKSLKGKVIGIINGDKLYLNN